MTATPNPNRRSGYSTAPPTPLPFLTPRPERRLLDLRWAEGSAARSRNHSFGDRQANVQVIVRCRPLTDDEERFNVQSVISCDELKRKVTVLQSLASKQVDKTFTFDKVFGPTAQQRLVYYNAIAPVVNDVLEGYNCTVFAFGQTGTGKTYSMEGEMKAKVTELPDNAGVIPRVVRDIFKTLELRKADFSMKVTFLELYNEEIMDLLSKEDQTRPPEDRQRRPITLLEDGKGGAVIRGLEEVAVSSMAEIHNLLERGSSRRRTAETLLNKQSSRSHSVFSVNILLKESSCEGEELVTFGRLNLVDLAGSENIARSGARERREAGEMNKSVLTLGRVINALVEHSSHVPYRDSKLTRLLRDSLGGKAKTWIIATISPSIQSLEETLVTLDYASQARSIRNKPEANKKLSKSVLVKNLCQEIERMKQDVTAAREKNGVYIPSERFAQEEAEKKAMRERILSLESSLDDYREKAGNFVELYQREKDHCLQLEKKIQDCETNLETSRKVIIDLQEVHKRKDITLKEKDFIISNFLSSQNAMFARAKDLHGDLETQSRDVSVLRRKLEKKFKTEKENQDLLLDFELGLDHHLEKLHDMVNRSAREQKQVLREMEDQMNSNLASTRQSTKYLAGRIQGCREVFAAEVNNLKIFSCSIQEESNSDFVEVNTTIAVQAMAIENVLVTIVSEAEQLLRDLGNYIDEQKAVLALTSKQQNMNMQHLLEKSATVSRNMSEYFDNIKKRTYQLQMLSANSKLDSFQQLMSFEKRFKEVSAREEKAALDNISAILSSLTDVKIHMVSEAVGVIADQSKQVDEKLQQQISGIQCNADEIAQKWSIHTKEVEKIADEEMNTATKITSEIVDVLEHCSREVRNSSAHWSLVELSINRLNKDYVMETKDSFEESSQYNYNKWKDLDNHLSVSSLKFAQVMDDIMVATENSLLKDSESRRYMESLVRSQSNALASLQDNHAQSTQDLRKLASKCFLRDYLIGSPIVSVNNGVKTCSRLPRKESIEEMRMSLSGLVKQFRSENMLEEHSHDSHQG